MRSPQHFKIRDAGPFPRNRNMYSNRFSFTQRPRRDFHFMSDVYMRGSFEIVFAAMNVILYERVVARITGFGSRPNFRISLAKRSSKAVQVTNLSVYVNPICLIFHAQFFQFFRGHNRNFFLHDQKSLFRTQSISFLQVLQYSKFQFQSAAQRVICCFVIQICRDSAAGILKETAPFFLRDCFR